MYVAAQSFPQVCIRSFIDDCINAKFSSDDAELHIHNPQLWTKAAWFYQLEQY